MKTNLGTKAWWTKPLVYMLALALTLGSFLSILPATEVQADRPVVGPGGVTEGLVLWLRPDVGVSTVQSGVTDAVYSVNRWEDQSSKGNHARQSTVGSQPLLDVAPQNLVNFNPMLTFNGAQRMELDVNKLPTGTSDRSIVSVAATATLSTSPAFRYIISWGTASGGGMMGMLQFTEPGKTEARAAALSSYGDQFASNTFWHVNQPNELFATYNGTTNYAALYSRMNTIGSANKPNWYTGNVSAVVGGIIGSGQNWDGQIADIVVYDRVLTANERLRISSYLSLKYGYTLVNANYLNSDAAAIWSNTGNAGYTANIAGIGRDDFGQLNQKQSHSTNSGQQVILSLGDIAASNAANLSTFAADKQYLLWGDNGQTTVLGQEIGENGESGKRMNRVWKVQNTGGVSNTTVAFPVAALSSVNDPVLLVSDSASDFTQATTHTLTQQTINGQPYYVASGVTLDNSQYFTYGEVYTTPNLQSISFAKDTNGNKTIKVKFDGPVDLEQINALKVIHDGETLSFYAGVTSGDELVLLVDDPRVNHASDIIVSYDGQGGLVGNVSRKSVAPFSQSPIDPLSAALTVVKPENPSPAAQLELAGKSLADASVTAAVYNQDGQVVYQSGPVTVDADGNWSLPDTDTLPDGVYQIVVQSEKDDAVAQTTRTVIITSALEAKLAAAKAYKPGPYTTESWQKFQTELAEAERLLQARPFDAAIYAEAQAKLASALNALVPLSGNLTSVEISSGTEVVSMEPAFRSDHTGTYSSNVPYGVSEISFAPIAAEANTTQKLVLNGKEIAAEDWDKLPLEVGKNTIEVSVYDQDNNLLRTYTFEITRNQAPYWGGGFTPPVDTTKPESDGLSRVDGKNDSFATAEKDGESTEVSINRERLGTILADGKEHDLHVILDEEGPVVVKGLTAEDVRQIRESGSTLEIETPNVRYPVSLSDEELQALSANFGGAALEDIAVTVTIQPTDSKQADAIKAHAAARSLELLVDPVHVSLDFEHDGKTLTLDKRSGYAPVYVALPEGIDPNRITTGVVTFPDGTIFHMPTVVIQSNSRYYAQIHALFTSGDYTVIWNPKQFDDVSSHWSQEAANNMGARLVIEGIGGNLFGPDREVTRAEFAAFISRGLGLMREQADEAGYADVSRTAWYHDAVSIANEFAIVSGYEDGLYRPDQRITREQGMALIARAVRLIDPTLSLSQPQIDVVLNKYQDGSNVSTWAKADVALLIDHGIVLGEDKLMLNPQDDMTRAEAAALVHRILQFTGLID